MQEKGTTANKMSLRSRFEVTVRGFGLLRQYCPNLAQDKALCELVSALQPFISVWFTAQIINELSVQRRIRTIVLWAVCVVCFNFACAVLRGILNRVCSEKDSQMWSWFGKIFSDKQMSLDYADLENAGIRHQKQQIEENLFMFGNGLAQLVWGTSMLVRAAVNIVAAVVMTFSLFASKSGSAVLDSTVWIVLLTGCIALGGLCNSRAYVRENDVFVRWCRDTVWFNRTYDFFGKDLYMDTERAKDVRIYGQNAVAEQVLDGLMHKDAYSGADVLRMAGYPALARAVTGLVHMVCYLFVAAKSFFGAFGVGSIVQYVTVLSRLGGGLQDLAFVFADNAVYCGYLREMFDYLDIPGSRYEGTIPVEKRSFCEGGDCEYEIEFRNVSFQYPGTERFVLKDVSFKFQVGRRFAIVGMNGSGKTTLIKLICRLYEPSEGAILLNGVDIRKYAYQEYVSIFSVVFQDFKLFSFSLAQNVAAGVEYDAARVRACLDKVGFGARLSRMPKGIKTSLYKDFERDGIEPSGGEAQKIALARAVYKNAPFIILDEPTAALDPVAEAEVYAAFNEIVGGRTAVYISHRLSSCRFCDQIMVFHEGALVQQGTHSELVAQAGGKYAELWNAQAQYYI